MKSFLFVSLLPFSVYLSLGSSTVASVIDEKDKVKAVVFEQDFEGHSPALRTERWQGISPVWRVEPAKRKGLMQSDTSPVTRIAYYRRGLEWADYNFLCRVRVLQWGGQTKNFSWSGKQYRRVYWGMALRVQDAANGYRLEYVPWLPEDGGLKQSFYRLVKYTGGERKEMSRVFAQFHSDLDYLVRFEAQGEKLLAKIWPCGELEPEEWTISATDTDHLTGTVGFVTANCSMLFGDIKVTNTRDREVLLEEDFSNELCPEGEWHALSGQWKRAPWGNRLLCMNSNGEVLPAIEPRVVLSLPAEVEMDLNLGRKGKTRFVITPVDGEIQSEVILELSSGKASLIDNNGLKVGEGRFPLVPGADYHLRLLLEEKNLKLLACSYPLQGEETTFDLLFQLPVEMKRLRFGIDPGGTEGSSMDNLVCRATAGTRKALEEYLRYICDWYMELELPTGYPKTGSGSPELFIASYCTRTLMAGAMILDEPAYLEEALRWADFVCTSPSVLVPVVTGKGREALALRTFADWSACINMADIGSVLLGVGVLAPWAGDERRQTYLNVMEKYSRYVVEGCLEDPLTLGRGYRPQGWRVSTGPDRGGILNGYWWMDRAEEPWDISTTNVGLQFYSVLYKLTGNMDYRRYAREAIDWYLDKEVDTGAVFESFHDVIYGGEALIAAFEHAADESRKKRIDEAMNKLCRWLVEHQNADGTWNQVETPRNNRTNLAWHLLDWYILRHPEDIAMRHALLRTIKYHLNRANSRRTGVCEVLRKTCFTGASVADLLKPGITIGLR
ncbi:hypothetical protein ACFL5K_00275 [Gemmatimonadota bacterium]